MKDDGAMDIAIKFGPRAPRARIALTEKIRSYGDKRAAEAAAPGNQIEKLQAFKDYVHKRLDDAGIPTHPNGAHSKEGCRIGDRLDIILAAEALSMLPRAIPSGPEAASPAAGWRPMDSSPRDGTFYLGAYKGQYHPKIVCEDEGGFWWDDQGGQAHAPMAWMPLPSPPVLPLKKESSSPSEEARAG